MATPPPAGATSATRAQRLHGPLVLAVVLVLGSGLLHGVAGCVDFWDACPGAVPISEVVLTWGNDDKPETWRPQDVLTTSSKDCNNHDEYDFRGDGASPADGYLRGRHSNMVISRCNMFLCNCDPCGSCGRNYTVYDTLAKKTVTGPGGRPSCSNGPADKGCTTAAGACDQDCGDSNTAVGCAVCPNTLTGSGGAIDPSCPDLQEVLKMSVGELARRLSSMFCLDGPVAGPGAFTSDGAGAGTGFVGFTFVGAMLDLVDANDDGTISCQEYARAFADQVARAGVQLPRPRCKLSVQGSRMWRMINSGKGRPHGG